ncbi:hypothetical protein ACI09J_001773 [Cronobacter turicensis]
MSEVTEIPRYRVTAKSFIDGALLEEGAEITFTGVPGLALFPLNDAAKAAKKQAGQARGSIAGSEQPLPGALLTGGGEGSEGDGDDDGEGDGNDLQTLRQQYEELFHEKPGNMKAETLKARIAAKRTELGI